MESRQNGTCKWFNATKGFGFITDSSGGGDLFVHHTCINGEGFKTLLEGEAVEFDVQIDERGRKKAVNVSGPNGSRVIGDQRGQGMPPRGGHGDDRGYPQGGSYSGRSGGGRHYQGGASGGRDYNGGGYAGQRDYQSGGAMGGGYSSRYGNGGGDYQSSRGAY